MDGKLTKLPDLLKISQEFEENIKINLAISTIPAFFCIGGVFLLGWSALTTVVITESVFVSGLMNSTWPLIRYIGQEDKLMKTR